MVKLRRNTATTPATLVGQTLAEPPLFTLKTNHSGWFCWLNILNILHAEAAQDESGEFIFIT